MSHGYTLGGTRGRVLDERNEVTGKPAFERHRLHLDAEAGASASRDRRVYGVRPMNASSLVWVSASSGTSTRGP
jgi:hypothetical protein